MLMVIEQGGLELSVEVCHHIGLVVRTREYSANALILPVGARSSSVLARSLLAATCKDEGGRVNPNDAAAIGLEFSWSPLRLAQTNARSRRGVAP